MAKRFSTESFLDIQSMMQDDIMNEACIINDLNENEPPAAIAPDPIVPMQIAMPLPPLPALPPSPPPQLEPVVPIQAPAPREPEPELASVHLNQPIREALLNQQNPNVNVSLDHGASDPSGLVGGDRSIDSSRYQGESSLVVDQHQFIPVAQNSTGMMPEERQADQDNFLILQNAEQSSEVHVHVHVQVSIDRNDDTSAETRGPIDSTVQQHILFSDMQNAEAIAALPNRSDQSVSSVQSSFHVLLEGTSNASANDEQPSFATSSNVTPGFTIENLKRPPIRNGSKEITKRFHGQSESAEQTQAGSSGADSQANSGLDKSSRTGTDALVSAKINNRVDD